MRNGRRISRREWLATATGLAAGAAMPLRAQSARPPAVTPVSFPVPAGACDCHAHVFGDPRRFPFFAGRAYTPPSAPVEALSAMHAAIHTNRVVLVQPSVYGTDNRCLVDALRRLGRSARGVAVADDGVTDETLDELDRAGVCGLRLNLETGGVPDLDVIRRRIRAGLERASARGWHVQLFTRLQVLASIQDLIVTSPVQIVVDHFCQAAGAQGIGQPGFYALQQLLKNDMIYLKVSAPYLCSTKAPEYADMAPIARALVEANPRRILWGSDWPHVNTTPVTGRTPADIWPFYQIDDGLVFNQLAVWVPDAAVRKTILVDTPASLYGFD
jgi:predicted TIM-barrel fold metal-dependent hydrolase